MQGLASVPALRRQWGLGAHTKAIKQIAIFVQLTLATGLFDPKEAVRAFVNDAGRFFIAVSGLRNGGQRLAEPQRVAARWFRARPMMAPNA